MKPQVDCLFCSDPRNEIVETHELTWIRRDAYPVSPGHLLIIPRRHVASLFDATDAERAEIFRLVTRAKGIVEIDHKPDGYNVGINIGKAAGQSVMHVHLHVIPRYFGDVPEPKGGVRWVIPQKAKYVRVPD